MSAATATEVAAVEGVRMHRNVSGHGLWRGNRQWLKSFETSPIASIFNVDTSQVFSLKTVYI